MNEEGNKKHNKQKVHGSLLFVSFVIKNIWRKQHEEVEEEATNQVTILLHPQPATPHITYSTTKLISNGIKELKNQLATAVCSLLGFIWETGSFPRWAQI